MPGNTSLMVQKIAVLQPKTKERQALEKILDRAGYSLMEHTVEPEQLGDDLSMALQYELLAPLADGHLLILEVPFGHLEGTTLIRLLKENKYTVHIPIMVITQDNRYESVLSCIRAGAADYLVRPINEQILLRRVALLLGRNGAGEPGQGVESVVWNFHDFLVKELKRAERSNLPLSIVLGQLRSAEEVRQGKMPLQGARDNLIDIRLQFLEGLMADIRHHIRETDTLLRYGSQGLILVLPMTPSEGAGIVEDRLQDIFQITRNEDDVLELRSVELYTGASSYPDEASSKHDLLMQAEKNLLEREEGKQPKRKSSKVMDEQVFWKTLFCPVCKEKFQVEKARDRAFRLQGRESDFRLLYEKGNPLIYAIPVCPKCYYASFYPDFERLTEPEMVKLRRSRLARGRLARKVNLRTSRTLESAVVSYQLAAECYQRRQTPPSTFARLYHRAAWLLRESGKSEVEREMLEKALQYYERAFRREDLKGKKLSDQEVAYLVGELSLRLGKPRQALEYFKMVIESSRKNPKSQIAILVRERWHDAREALNLHPEKTKSRV